MMKKISYYHIHVPGGPLLKSMGSNRSLQLIPVFLLARFQVVENPGLPPPTLACLKNLKALKILEKILYVLNIRTWLCLYTHKPFYNTVDYSTALDRT